MSSRRAMLALLPVLLVGRIGARGARAAIQPATIRMDVQGCPPAWASEIRLTIAVELGDERLADSSLGDRPTTSETSRPDGVAGYTLSIRCDERRARVVARDSKTAVTLERTLTDMPEATAPRLVALVAVELLTTFDPALRRRLEAPTRPSKPPPPPPVAIVPQAAPEDRRLSLTAGWVYRAFLTSGGVQAWGGTLDGRRASQSGRWSLGLGLEVARDERSTAIGEMSALLGSARVSAGGRAALARDRLVLSFDVGGRAGAVRLSGHSSDSNVVASTVVRPWAGPVATLRAQVGVSWFCAEIAAEAGWAAVSASGLVNAATGLSAGGPWLAISLGVGSRG